MIGMNSCAKATLLVAYGGRGDLKPIGPFAPAHHRFCCNRRDSRDAQDHSLADRFATPLPAPRA